MKIRSVLMVSMMVLAFGLGGSTSAVAAQPATPAVGAVCGVTPQSIEELVALAFPDGTPAAADLSPMAVAAESALPQGVPVEAETAAAIDAVVQSWLVCIAAGDDLRLFALMSDDLDAIVVRQLITDPQTDTPQELRAWLENDIEAPLIVASTDSLATPGRDLRQLDDGRIGGIWLVDGDAAFILLAQENDAWVIDEVIDIPEE